MAKFTSADLRNVAVIGHGDTGKTTVVSACLYAAGEVNRMGLVEQGSSITDYDEEEIDRQISIQAAMAHCSWKDRQITFLDTPGYNVFRPEAKAAVQVADSVALVVDAVSGPQVMSDTTWRYGEEQDLAAMIVINRLDRENASFSRTVDSLVDRYGREAVPVQIPLGEEHDLEGVVDLLEMKAYRYERDGDGKGKAEEVPDDLVAEAESRREALVEMVAEGDEALMERFFEAGDLTADELVEGIRKAVSQRLFFPVVCVSALHNIGTDRVLDTIARFMPSPLERQGFTVVDEEGEEERRRIDPGAPFAALAFKTVADPYAGRISLLKVFSGSAAEDDRIVDSRTGDKERMSNLTLAQGKEYEPVGEVLAGQLCAVAKLKDVQTGDTLHDPSAPVKIRPVDFPKAAISFALKPESKGDEEKISQSLARLVEEDPTLEVGRDSQTGELLISGLGQLHVEVTVAKLRRRFGVNALLNPPKVPYRETIRRTARAEGRHKKQTGGRGQFGVCVIEMSPLPTGSGFEFEDQIFGGSIPQQFRPAVEKGVVEAAQKGVLAGYPLVDFKVTLLDGKFHSVDSSEMAFKIAGSLAFKQAAREAAPVLLEPVMDVEIVVPDDAMGDVMGDLNSRRGRVQGMVPRGATQVIKAEVPLSEVLQYAPDLNSLTGGRGTYTMEFTHYAEVPANIAQRIIEKAHQEEDEG